MSEPRERSPAHSLRPTNQQIRGAEFGFRVG